MVVVRGRPNPINGKEWKNPNPKECLRLVCQNSRVIKIFEPGDHYNEDESYFWDSYWWGIHGLYVEPESLPVNPNFRKFDPKLVPPELRIRALQHWPCVFPLRPQRLWKPKVTRESQSEDLWAAQFNKKGPRCRMNQTEYMETTLDWFDEVESHIIQAIKGSTNIQNKVIDVRAFNSYFDRTPITRPVIRVFYHPLKKRQFLRELHFNCTIAKPYIYLTAQETSGVPSDLDWSKDWSRMIN